MPEQRTRNRDGSPVVASITRFTCSLKVCGGEDETTYAKGTTTLGRRVGRFVVQVPEYRGETCIGLQHLAVRCSCPAGQAGPNKHLVDGAELLKRWMERANVQADHQRLLEPETAFTVGRDALVNARRRAYDRNLSIARRLGLRVPASMWLDDRRADPGWGAVHADTQLEVPL